MTAMNACLYSYIAICGLFWAAYMTLFCVTELKWPGMSSGICIVLASAFWPITLLIQLGMFVAFWIEMKWWEDIRR